MEKVKKIKVTKKSLVLLLALFLVVGGTVIAGLYYYTMQDMGKVCKEMTSLVANSVDGDNIQQYVDKRKKDKKYEKLQAMMDSYEKSFSYFNSQLYIYAIRDDKILGVVQGHKGSAVGKNEMDLYYNESVSTSFKQSPIYDQITGRIDKDVANIDCAEGHNGFGECVTSWNIIRNSNEEAVAVVQANISTNWIKIRMLIAAGIVILFSILFMIFYGGVSRKIVKLSKEEADKDEVPDKSAKNKRDSKDIKELEKELENKNGIDRVNSGIKLVNAEKAPEDILLHLQSAMHAGSFPYSKSYDLYANINMALKSGGNFFDFYVKNDKVFFWMGDLVCAKGKNIMLMGITKAIFKGILTKKLDIENAIIKTNDRLIEFYEGSDLKITMFIGQLDLTNGELTYVNAGHNNPFIKNGDEVKVLECKDNIEVGVKKGYEYKTESLSLEENSMLLMYTDGFINAKNPEDEEYSFDRLNNFVIKKKNLGMKRLIESLTEDFDDFVKEKEICDDATVMGVKFKKVK